MSGEVEPAAEDLMGVEEWSRRFYDQVQKDLEDDGYEGSRWYLRFLCPCEGWYSRPSLPCERGSGTDANGTIWSWMRVGHFVSIEQVYSLRRA